MEIKNIKKYINLCMKGYFTVPQKLQIIKNQKIALNNKIKEMQNELKILTTKEEHYKMVLDQNVTDEWNPVNFAKIIKEKIK